MPEKEEKPQKKELKFNIKEENMLGTYSNVVRISHSPHDFTLDFGQFIPEKQLFEVLNRIKMSPSHAKALLSALADNVQKYEASFGEIKLVGEKPSLNVKAKKRKEDLTYIG